MIIDAQSKFTHPLNSFAPPLVRENDLNHLPAPVRRYMEYCGVVGTEWIDTVRVRYHGKFRTAPNAAWMPIRAEQTYTTNPASFVWNARFSFAGLPVMHGVDTFKSGHSHMHGKLAGLFTVVDGQGDEVDQGTMIRYLQEMTWFPTAYLGGNVTWTAVDDHAADVTLNDYGKSVTGRMYFDDRGRMLSFEAKRFGEFGGRYAMQRWTTPMNEYGTFGGLRIPVTGRGVWQLPEGDFAYVDVRVTDVAYNAPFERKSH